MSYILEALKRAERERRAGSSSSLLDEVPSAGGSSATPGWQRWATPAAIAALALAIVTYLIVEHGTHTTPAANAGAAASVAAVPQIAKTAAAPAASASTPVSPAPQAAPVETTVTASAPTIEDDGRISSLTDLDDKPAPVASPAQIQNENGDAVSSTSPAAHASSSGDAEEASASDDGANGPRAIVDGRTATAEAPAPSSAKPAATATENLREMPDDFRASFPAITVDVHAYAEDAAQRFVLIGGNRYHENDTLPQGPKIFAIVPEGIVFDWQGQRVLYALAGH